MVYFILTSLDGLRARDKAGIQLYVISWVFACFFIYVYVHVSGIVIVGSFNWAKMLDFCFR